MKDEEVYDRLTAISVIAKVLAKKEEGTENEETHDLLTAISVVAKTLAKNITEKHEGD